MNEQKIETTSDQEFSLNPLSWIIPRKNKERALMDLVHQSLLPLGYELVDLHVFQTKHKKIQIFIDRLVNHISPNALEHKSPIGIEDCVRATHALNDILDTSELITDLFNENEYELEVSSPGVFRPLAQEKDFTVYQGKQVRLSTIRALTEEELQNPEYAQKNPKQKNFLGILLGSLEKKALLNMPPQEGHKFKPKKGQKISLKKLNEQLAEYQKIEIPFSLITKAHLEPGIEELAKSQGNEKGK